MAGRPGRVRLLKQLSKGVKNCRHVGHNSGRSDILTVFSVVNYTNVGGKEILPKIRLLKPEVFVGNDLNRNDSAPAVSFAAQVAAAIYLFFEGRSAGTDTAVHKGEKQA